MYCSGFVFLSKSAFLGERCQAGLFTGHDRARGSGQEYFPYLADRVGSGQEVFHMSRVGTGRVKKFSEKSLVGAGHLDPTRPVNGIPTREKPPK